MYIYLVVFNLTASPRYVLDGYPQTKKQVELMTQCNIIPVRVIELVMDSKEVMVRGMKDRISPSRSVARRHASFTLYYIPLQVKFHCRKKKK